MSEDWAETRSAAVCSSMAQPNNHSTKRDVTSDESQVYLQTIWK